MIAYSDIAIAKATSRSRGSVGARAVVPRVVRRLAHPGDSILDYGAGREALHAQALRAEGYRVTAHDLWATPGIHDPDALKRKYDLVYASNVANVWASLGMAALSVAQMFHAVRPGGLLVLNLPASPRKGAWDAFGPREAGEALRFVLKDFFLDVHNADESTPSSPVFVCLRGAR